MKKRFLTRQRLRKMFNRYEYHTVELKVYYPVDGRTNIVNEIEVIHPSRKKVLLRYDNREKKWQLLWPKISPAIGRNRKPTMGYHFSKFRWRTLSYDVRHMINRQLDAMITDLKFEFFYHDQDKYFESIHLLTA